MSSAQIPTLTNADAKFDASDEKNLGVEHGDNTNRYEAGLSGAQRTLAVAAEQEKSKSLGTFTAIKYYWVAFLWSQYCSFGAILVGYDGTVSRFSVSEAHIA
jgi:hypothetical protein